MEYREKILTLARTQPVLPSGVAKALNTNSIMAGAMLSEMCSKGLLKTSALRVGGSPLYLIPGNEAQLLNHLNSLNEKDRKTVELLRENKVIGEREADPLTRVSLTTIKDFAKPLTVTYNNQNETYWKWFEITDDEAKHHIGKKINPQPVKEQPKQETKKEIAESIQQERPKQETKVDPAETKEKIPEKPKPTGEFWQDILNFLKENNITLVQHEQIKKKTEYDMIVELDSPVGKLTYYCKARSKKKLTDADISAAYVTGQIKKLPTILLTDGELNKQANAILTQLKGITIKKL